MKLNRVFAYIIGCIALILSVLVYLQYIYMLGFPDGFITELGYAQRRLSYIFIGVSVVLGLRSIYLGWVASRKEISKKLFITIFVYLIFAISIYAIDCYYRLHLKGSVGG